MTPGGMSQMKKYQLESLDRKPGAQAAAVRVTGEVDIDCAPELRQELEQILQDGCVHLVVDIDEVTHLDSYSLGAFVGVRQHARAKGGSLGFVCHNPMLRRLFTMTNLDKLFEFHETVEGFFTSRATPAR